MPQFHYRAVEADGHITEGVVQSPTMLAASKSLEQQGMRVLDLQGATTPVPAGHASHAASQQASGPIVIHRSPATPPAPTPHLPVPALNAQRAPRFRPWAWDLLGAPALSQQQFFFRQLHALVSASVPLVQAFDTLEQNTQSTTLKRLAHAMRENASAGQPISDAFAKVPGIFPRRIVNTIRAGEAGGYLPIALRQVIDYLDGGARCTGMAISDMFLRRFLVWMIPLTLISLGFGFFTHWGLSQSGLHNSNGSRAPFYIALRIYTQISFLVALVIIGILASNPRFRREWEKIAAKMPGLGPISAFSREAHFARSMSQLLRSGMEISKAFEFAISAPGDAAMEARLTPQVEAIRKGKPLFEVLEESSFFSKFTVDFARVGQVSGTLPDSLDQAAYYAEQEVVSRQPRRGPWRLF
jgi:type IV pilus assembly protein PilC